jgi:1-deoxyxylulose-5-phosphate synthase
MSATVGEAEDDDVVTLRLKKVEVEALAGTLLSVLRLNKWERRKMVDLLQRASGLTLYDPTRTKEGPDTRPVKKRVKLPEVVSNTVDTDTDTTAVPKLLPPQPLLDDRSAKASIVLVGCGEIAELYIGCLLTKPGYCIAGVVDVDLQRATDFARRVETLQRGSPCLVGPDIDGFFRQNPFPKGGKRKVVAINLTPAKHHFETNRALLRCGCHVWSEKPLASTFHEAQALVQMAAEQHLELGCAPSTHYGESQECAAVHINDRRLLGDIQYVRANMFCGCFEPEAFRLNGGWKRHRRLAIGSLRDVGIYPLSWLTSLFGPVESVVAQQQDPALDMYIVQINFSALGHRGVVATLASSMSLSAPRDRAFCIEFHGSQGSLIMKSVWNCDSTLEFCADGGQLGAGTTVSLLPFAPWYKPSHSTSHPIKTDWAAGVDRLCVSVDKNTKRTFTGKHAAHLCDILDCIERSVAGGGKRVAVESTYPTDAQVWRSQCLTRLGSVTFPLADQTKCAVSKLIFGTMSLGDVSEPFDLLDAAWNMGCNAFDLAHVYGRKPESTFGNWLSKRVSAPTLRCGGVSRASVFIIGKGGHSHVKSPKKARLSEEDITKDLNESLERINIDYFDLYLLHRDDPNEFPDLLRIVRLMTVLQNMGKFKSWGVSNWSVERVIAACKCADENDLCRPACSSPNYSLAIPSRPVWPGTTHMRPGDDKIYKENRVMLLTWAALAEGWLLPNGLRRPDNRSCWDALPVNVERKRRAAAFAQDRGITVAQVLTAYVLASGADAVVVGCRTIDHMQDLVKGTSVSLTANEVAWLRA